MGEDSILTIVGKVVKPHGLGGEVKVFSYIEKPEFFKQWKSVFIEKSGEDGEWINIENVRFQHRLVLLKFEDVNERDEAELLRGSLLYIDREAAKNLGENSFSLRDITNFKVETVSGRKIGAVEDILIHSAQNIIIVKRGNKEFLIPFVKEFVKQIDRKSRRVIINPIKGLLDNAD